MVLSPWLSSIASWKKPSSSRFKVSPIVHTAPEKENRRRKRSRSLSLDRLQGPHLNLDTTERNHDTGPHSAAKVDHFFAAADRREKMRVVMLTLDTMVMDNDEALQREGCDPTYKKVKGFQPLHLIWEGKIVDAIFRRGKR